MRGTARVGHRVVDIAHRRRGVTAREPTRQVSPPDELGQRRRRPIARLRSPRRHRQGFEPRRLRQGAHRLGGQDPEPRQIPRRVAGAVDGGLFGQHMDDDRPHRRAGGRGRAVRAMRTRTPTGPARRPTPRRHRRGAARGARIIRAHAARQRIQALIERRGIGGVDVGPDPGHPRTGWLDLDEALLVGLGWDPHPGRVELGHPQIDPVGQFGPRQSHPLRHMPGQRRIQPGHHLVIDGRGAGDDRHHHPEINRPGREHRRHRRQLVAQRPRIPDQPRGPAPTDVQRRRHLRSHLLPRIGTPQVAVGQLPRPTRIQLADRDQPARTRRVLLPRRRRHRVHQVGVGKSFEHVFDITRLH